MGSLIICFTLITFNTLLVLAAAHDPGWPSFKLVNVKTFYQCMSSNPNPNPIPVPFSDFYSPTIDNTSFTSVYNSTAQNFRCLESTLRKPFLIFRPDNEAQVSPAIWCARLFNLNIRIRSGGHDYEGLSYISLMKNQKFMILDLYNLRNVSIDTQNRTAWVQAGATNGELYYKISQASKNLAFPAGLCSTLGIGGHIPGGGYGFLMRAFGLAGDNILDVRMVDALGNVRSKQLNTMDDDLFWALSGGGGGNFGVITAYKIRLVRVPTKVSVFTVVKTRETNGAAILNKWQYVAPNTDQNLFIRAMMQTTPNTVLTIYQAVYLGRANKLVSLMTKQFPELGLTPAQCTEMSWIESVMVIAGFNTSLYKPDYLLQHKPAFEVFYLKAKSDFLREPMSIDEIEGMWDIFKEQSPLSLIIWNPYGGMMAKIPENATPFPHRVGVICKIQYAASWVEPGQAARDKNEELVGRLYDYMGDYVSKNPREAYVNYRDLDIGMAGTGSNCSHPSIWGPKYFKGNYQKLVDVKTKVDPFNFFKSEQSIPTKWVQNKCTVIL